MLPQHTIQNEMSKKVFRPSAKISGSTMRPQRVNSSHVLRQLLAGRSPNMKGVLIGGGYVPNQINILHIIASPSLLVVEALASNTVKSLVSSLLIALNDPFPASGALADKINRIKHACVNQKINLIIIQESHNLLVNKIVVNANASKLLTGILNSTQIPFLLFGKMGSKRIIREYPELANRIESEVKVSTLINKL